MLSKNREEEVFQAVLRGLLEVHEDGSVWRVAVARTSRWDGTVRIYRASPHRIDPSVGPGYRLVHATVDGKQRTCLAHRLAWRALRGQIPDGMVINHKNGDKADNRPENLEVVTPSENTIHAYQIGLMDEHGEVNPAAKLSNAQVEEIRLRCAAGAETQEEIAADFGVAFQTVSKIARGQSRVQQGGPTRDYSDRRSSPFRDRNPLGQFA